MTYREQIRIGVFGGTFDPPHIGHLELARSVIDEDLVDSVLIVPCFRHALGKKPVAFEHRVAMCELLIAGEPKMLVSDEEARLAHPGRTLELIAALESAYPDAALRLIAGSDIYYEKDKWYRFDEVERRAPPIYVSRKGVPPLPVPALPAPTDVSSSGIRAALLLGRSPRDMLPSAVAEYIERHRLYGAST